MTDNVVVDDAARQQRKEEIKALIVSHDDDIDNYIKDLVNARLTEERRLEDEFVLQRLENLEQYREEEHQDNFSGLWEELKHRVEKLEDSLNAEDQVNFWGERIVETLKRIEEHTVDKNFKKELWEQCSSSQHFLFLNEKDRARIKQSLLAKSSPHHEDTKVKLKNFIDKFEKFIDEWISVYNLPEDTTSLIMVNGWPTLSGIVGLFVYVFQAVVITFILLEETISESIDTTTNETSLKFGWWEKHPYKVDFKVRCGQFLAAFLASITQSDLLESLLVPILTNTRKKAFEEAFDTSRHDCCNLLPFWKITLPNFIKFSIGLLSLLTSLIVIATGDNWLDLLKDYTAVWFVSEIDNYVFAFIKLGYCGQPLSRDAKKVSDVDIEYLKSNWWSGFRSVFILFLNIIMFLYIGCVWYRQNNGSLFALQFPKCSIVVKHATTYTVYPEKFALLKNGICNTQLNEVYCDEDGGDCNFEKHWQYTECEINTAPKDLGNGHCQSQYRNPFCGWDDFDCFNDIFSNDEEDLCKRETMSNRFCGDGNVGSNGSLCRWDGWDCFDKVFPKCSAGDNTKLLANGECNKENNHASCAWDGWDCFYEQFPSCEGNLSLLADGKCDGVNNNVLCAFDGYDCFNQNFDSDCREKISIECNIYKRCQISGPEKCIDLNSTLCNTDNNVTCVSVQEPPPPLSDGGNLTSNIFGGLTAVLLLVALLACLGCSIYQKKRKGEDVLRISSRDERRFG